MANNENGTQNRRQQANRNQDLRKEVAIVNAVVTSRTGTAVQAVLARLRGDVPTLPNGSPNPDYDGRTLRIHPALFKDGLPMAGEAIYLQFAEGALEENGPNYRVLRNAKASINPPAEGTRGFNGADQLPEGAGSNLSEAVREAYSEATPGADEAQLNAGEQAHEGLECKICGGPLNDEGHCIKALESPDGECKPF